ncbi:aminoglycoside phosphotransferase family protein [Streptacidiphilus pinicola]|uniref:Aminoglycoside phosphotransferase family protein n=1 Tax=Streptacidiphilus pinicola TaxID=2219663 RepID=A0A2X0K953_9ACTN|nr:phosphotransferase [Streptacidiphilus pinicola]RAG83640.1 aminoglycoside phosphotransferase family protein [Streptacidiphilus pinicola]
MTTLEEADSAGTPGPLLGAGRTADVYALPGGRVLRRYRDGSDATGELAVMARLFEQGYAVPRVWPGPTRQDLVMERISGATLAEAVAAGTVSADAAGDVLATLLRSLHALPAHRSTDPADRVLHLDFHPLNVMLTPDGPVVIDWANTMEGPPALDRAMSALILAQAAVSMPEFATLARAVLQPFLDRLGPLDPTALARARALRAADPTLSAAEVAALDEALALLGPLGRPA